MELCHFDCFCVSFRYIVAFIVTKLELFNEFT
jgi:hypothetical protein